MKDTDAIEVALNVPTCVQGNALISKTSRVNVVVFEHTFGASRASNVGDAETIREGTSRRRPGPIGSMIVPIPVQRLGSSSRAAYLQHLVALDAEDRRLRFGIPQSSAAIAAYVERIDFNSNILFGAHGEALILHGVAHLAFSVGFAELGISVLPQMRRQGIGAALMRRAAEYARNRSIERLYVHCLAENVAMIRLARATGMHVVVESGDADAHIALPSATPMSIASEILAEHAALFDYALRANVETWRRIGIALTTSPPASVGADDTHYRYEDPSLWTNSPSRL